MRCKPKDALKKIKIQTILRHRQQCFLQLVTTQAVQRLTLCASIAASTVQSLVRKLRSHMMHDTA